MDFMRNVASQIASVLEIGTIEMLCTSLREFINIHSNHIRHRNVWNKHRRVTQLFTYKIDALYSIEWE